MKKKALVGRVSYIVMSLALFVSISMTISSIVPSYYDNWAGSFASSPVYAAGPDQFQSELNRLNKDFNQTRGEIQKTQTMNDVVVCFFLMCIFFTIGYLRVFFKRKKILAAINADDPTILPDKYTEKYNRENIPQNMRIQMAKEALDREFLLRPFVFGIFHSLGGLIVFLFVRIFG